MDEKSEKRDKHTFFSPSWIQTYLVSLIAAGFFYMNYEKISIGFTQWAVGISSLKLADLFLFSSVIAIFGIAYFLGITFLTGGWSNKLLSCRIRKKKAQLHKGEDQILRLIVPEVDKGWLKKDKIGEFKMNKKASVWLENGVNAFITTHGLAECIDVDDIKEKHVILTDPEVFEDRNRNAVLQARENESRILNPNELLKMAPILLIIAIGGYLIIGQLQTGSCQSELVSLAKSCGKIASSGNMTTTTTTIANGLNIPFMK